MKCVNEECTNNPTDYPSAIVVNANGDLACCIACKLVYERKNDEFFVQLVESSDKE